MSWNRQASNRISPWRSVSDWHYSSCGYAGVTSICIRLPCPATPPLKTPRQWRYFVDFWGLLIYGFSVRCGTLTISKVFHKRGAI
jgi:hypothetical protein